MDRLLDSLAVLLLALSAVLLAASVWLMGTHEDFSALFALVAGFVLLRSSVDLLRPRRLK